MKIKDMKEGDLFVAFHRLCTIADDRIMSLSDGWSGMTSSLAEHDCEPIEMPETPLQLVNFIRKYQNQEEDRYE